MDGITFVKFKSPYPEDKTKDAPLTITEMDANFATLEGRDIKSVSMNENRLVVELYNGKKLSTIINGLADDNCIVDANFDQPNGVLTLTLTDGTTRILEGFATKSNTGTTVYVDGTLVGNGTPGKPVGIAQTAKTGWYLPVEEIVHVCEGERLPDGRHVGVGTRFLTVEKINDFGFLYDYNALRKIAADLRAVNSPWRVPTKADWDDMLDAVEPCDEYRTHTVATPNRYLGKFAGKFLKSIDGWKGEHKHFHEDINNIEPSIGNDCCDCDDNKCMTPPVCGEYGKHHPDFKHPSKGIDKYGFCVTPAGYIDDGGNFVCFKERAAFWTATNSQFSTAFAKRFEFNRDDVHQDVLAGQYHLSLRLVKDYNGGNYNEREDILGHSYSTVLMPSVKDGHKIWTSVNVAFTDRCYNPMIPNDGQGLIFTKHFYLNEWNGKEWVRNELRDGESVVVKHASNGSKNTEFRVVGGELADVTKSLVKTVSNGFKHIINALSDDLKAEVERSLTEDAKHSSAIEELKEAVAKVESAPADIEAIKSDIESIQEDVKNINDKITSIETTHKEDIEKVEGEISTTKDELIKMGEGLKTEIEGQIESTKEDILNAGAALKSELEEKINNVQSNLDETQKTVEDTVKKLDEVETKTDENIKHLEDVDKKIGDIEKNIEDNQSSLADALEEISGSLPTQEGTEFDANTGVITIKSAEGLNDIEIPLTLNLGTF